MERVDGALSIALTGRVIVNDERIRRNGS